MRDKKVNCICQRYRQPATQAATECRHRLKRKNIHADPASVHFPKALSRTTDDEPKPSPRMIVVD